MRKSIAAAALIAAAAALPACGHAHGEDGGPAVSRNYQVGGFQKIEVAGPYDVEVRTGSKPTVAANGSEKLLEHTVVEVKGDKLSIRPEEHNGWFHSGWHHGKAHFVVTVPQLTRRDDRRVGRDQGRPVAGDSFEGSIAGSGGLELAAIDVQSLKLSIGGSGGIRSGTGKAKVAEYEIAGSGGIDAGASAPSRPRSRSPDRAASRPMRPARPKSTSWARATSRSPAAPSAPSARLDRATSAALKVDLTMLWEGGPCAPSSSPRIAILTLAAPAGAATRNFGITGFEKVRDRRAISRSADHRGRAVRPGQRLGRRARPGCDRGARQHARRPQQSSNWGGYPGTGHRAGRNQPRHPRAHRGLAERLRHARDRPRQGAEFDLSVQGSGAGEIGQRRRRPAEHQRRRHGERTARRQARQADRGGPRRFEPRCAGARGARMRPSAPKARRRSAPTSATR